MKVRWSPDAADDLEQVVRQIEKGSPAAARNVASTIFRGIASLRQSPRRGRTGGVDGTRELVFAPLPYIAVYRLTGNTIEIVRIFHGTQDWQK